MTLHKAMLRRESCRAYSSEPVAREKLHRLLEAACLAPSAGNGQPWRFHVVTHAETLAKLAPLTQISGINAFSGEAPCIIAVWELVADRMLERYGAAYNTWAPMDIGLSVAHLCLAAAQEGLGTCIMGVFDQAACKQLLGIPPEGTLRLLITVGYPREVKAPREKKRLPVDRVATFLE